MLQIIHLAFLAYTLMILARILGSWFPEFARHPIMQWIAQYTDPYLGFFKKFIPPIGMIDLSPLFALFALQLLERLILGIFR